MPGFDGKGPEGKGSMTGRAQGKCNKEKQSNNPEINSTNEYVQPLGLRRKSNSLCESQRKKGRLNKKENSERNS